LLHCRMLNSVDADATQSFCVAVVWLIGKQRKTSYPHNRRKSEAEVGMSKWWMALFVACRRNCNVEDGARKQLLRMELGRSSLSQDANHLEI